MLTELDVSITMNTEVYAAEIFERICPGKVDEEAAPTTTASSACASEMVFVFADAGAVGAAVVLAGIVVSTIVGGGPQMRNVTYAAGISVVTFVVAFAVIAIFVTSTPFTFPMATAAYISMAVPVAVSWLGVAAIKYRKFGAFLLLFFIAMTTGCLEAAHSLSFLRSWDRASPFLLFVGLLTLLNAPFDWASLGLTRALLRRGLELKGWWPFFLAVADALCTAVIIMLLALTMVIGVQTFDALAVHGGGKPVLPLIPLFDRLAAHPEAPEFWWVYALLLSTMIPSLINLAIGGTVLIRTIPGLSPALPHFLPAAGGVPTYDRAWIAAVLTMQTALGAIVGVAVQAFVAWALIFHAMPAVGLGLLDLARDLATLDLPTRAIKLLLGAPWGAFQIGWHKDGRAQDPVQRVGSRGAFIAACADARARLGESPQALWRTYSDVGRQTERNQTPRLLLSVAGRPT